MRYCDHWEPIDEVGIASIKNLWRHSNPTKPLPNKAFDVLHSSPGTCDLSINNSGVMEVVSECRCYTCPKNTLVLGQGFNGQGA